MSAIRTRSQIQSLIPVTEVVLAILLRSFKFSLSDKEIYWNIASVNYPTVGRESTKPALYLKVARVEE